MKILSDEKHKHIYSGKNKTVSYRYSCMAVALVAFDFNALFIVGSLSVTLDKSPGQVTGQSTWSIDIGRSLTSVAVRRKLNLGTQHYVLTTLYEDS